MVVESRQGEIQQIGFASELHADLPVEVLDYQALIERMGPAHFRSAQRVSFGLVFVVRGGTGRHTVDFEAIRMIPGRMVLVRPGQVQQWHLSGDLDASIVLARGSLCATPGWFPGGGAYGDLGSSLTTALDLVAALAREQDRFVPEVGSVELMNSLFAPLVALFRRAVDLRNEGALPPAYLAFRAAIESRLSFSRSVRDYVAELGYSQRTVNRACQLVAGVSAKAVLDERVLLEAKRLLAHSDRSVSAVAATLGFSEATNFNKFFVRGTGESPSQFRRRLRSAGYRAAVAD